MACPAARSRIRDASRGIAQTGTAFALLISVDPAVCRVAVRRHHAGTKGVKRKNGRLRSVGQHSGVLFGNLGDSRRFPRSDLRSDSTVIPITRFKFPSPLSSAARKRPAAQSLGPFSFLPSRKKNRRRWTEPRAAGKLFPSNQLLDRTGLPAAAISATPAASVVVEREADRPRRAIVSRAAIIP